MRGPERARAGDNDTTTLSLIPYRAEDDEKLGRAVTAEHVKAHFGDQAAAKVTRRECANRPALSFACAGSLLGGMTVSPGLDPHGKALRFALLQMGI